jgi:tRNA G18 (ribose-2'-O)-methylase SpoU
MSKIVLVLDNIRSTYNVGSLLRTADGLGITEVISIGITPHMRQLHDTRLPHIIERAEREIRKTALGGEILMKNHFENSHDAITYLKNNEYLLASIELADTSQSIKDFVFSKDIAIILGNEVHGVSPDLLAASSVVLEIPMRGAKESFNVAISGAIAMYELTRSD